MKKTYLVPTTTSIAFMGENLLQTSTIKVGGTTESFDAPKRDLWYDNEESTQNWE